jgi:hypothetical protein
MGCSTSVLRPRGLGSGRTSFLHLSGRFQPPFSNERPCYALREQRVQREQGRCIEHLEPRGSGQDEAR